MTKIIHTREELLSEMQKRGYSIKEQKDAIHIMYKIYGKEIVGITIILSIISIMVLLYGDIEGSMHYLKYLFATIFGLSLLLRLNEGVAMKDVIQKYLKDENIKHRHTIHEKIDMACIIAIFIAIIIII